MKKKKNYMEIYNYLIKLKKLTEVEYNKLISIYGVDVIDYVIDIIIQKNEKFLNKFSYYVERKIEKADDFDYSNLEIYLNELGASKKLTSEENMKYSNEAYEIVTKLMNIFNEEFDKHYVNQEGVIFNSIVDQVDFYLENCSDKSLSNKLIELKNKYIDVRNKLVNGNLMLVIRTLKQYYKNDESFVDIIQNGNLGLMQAVEKYDPKYDMLFTTYAYFLIRRTIRNSIKNSNVSCINTSYKAIEDNNTKLKVIEVLTNELGREPTNEEICLYMGIPLEKLNSIDVAFRNSISVYSSVISKMDDSETFLIDVIKDRNINIEEEICLKVSRLQFINYLKKFLSEKQVIVLLGRNGFYGDIMTYRELGEMLGMTKQAVDLSERRALNKIRCLSRKAIKDFLE